jgi:hypothetical protein
MEFEMSNLSSLKLIACQRQQGGNAKDARRKKLSEKLAEQIQLAKAQQSGASFELVKTRTVRDPKTGERKTEEIPRKLKPWWWAGDNGKTCITVRYGAKTLEIVKGKNAIETTGLASVITTLQVLKTAVEAGELDPQIEAISAKSKPELAASKVTPAKTAATKAA